MAEYIEVQENQEVMQIRRRELQLDSVEKLNNITPIIENIDNVNLNQIETDTSEIKSMIETNLDEQANLDDILDSVNKLNKNISSLKGQITKLSKKLENIEE